MESLHSLWECEDDLCDLDDTEPDVLPSSPPHELLEDGEIELASHSPQTDRLSFQFTANDLDAAIQSSKKVRKTNKAGRRKGKRRKMPDKKRALETDPKAFVARISRCLKEPKQYLINAAVERLGIDVVRDLVQEVETIEKNGGQLISSGERRRTPGGVLWNVVRSRYEEAYKTIMAAGRTYEKEQRQQKRKMDTSDMAVDGQPTKRQKTVVSGLGMTEQKAAQVKRTGVIMWPSRCTHMDYVQSKVDPNNKLALSRAQSAWAESVKKENRNTQDTKKGKVLAGHGDIEMLDEGMNRKASVADRLRIPIQYDDL